MLITPKDPIKEHIEAREGITNHFNKEMERILNANQHKDKYWILGKASIHRKGGRQLVKPFLQACEEKPPLVKKSFVYEVDNRRGVKTLLWVMHPDDSLSFPSLGKSIRVSGGQSGSQILLPK